MSKFQPIPDETRHIIMGEYAQGGVTQKELGEKYGFHYRQIASWFKKVGRYDEYQDINKRNRQFSAKRTMPESSRIKISSNKSVNWKGKKLDIKHGTISGILIPSPDHPNKNQQGYCYEHRLVVEEHLGRLLLKDEIVHHIDLDPTNNIIDNLLVMSKSEHTTLHYHLQLALVKMMDTNDLQKLSKYLLQNIRENPGILRENRKKKRKNEIKRKS